MLAPRSTGVVVAAGAPCGRNHQKRRGLRATTAPVDVQATLPKTSSRRMGGSVVTAGFADGGDAGGGAAASVAEPFLVHVQSVASKSAVTITIDRAPGCTLRSVR